MNITQFDLIIILVIIYFQTAGKAVVRPIAFKPVVSSKQAPSAQYSNNPQSPESYGSYEKPHIDDGYASQDSRSCSHNGTMRDSYVYDARPASYDSNQYREQKPTDCYQVTPSPTDNVGHYEQLLQDKERELVVLRESMEANERAIFQVNEEKRLSWENQMKDLTTEYHRRLRLQQDRAYKTEQELQDEIKKVSLDNQRMSAEKDQLQMQKEHNSLLQDQIKQLRVKNDDLSNRLTKVSCDCELLRQQDQEKTARVQNLEELVTVIKAENMNLTNELDEKRRTVKKLDRIPEKANSNSDLEITRLEQLLAERDLALREEREQYLHDRDMWEQEKKKVLQYQRQLQSNYIQMCRRNSDLEGSSSYPNATPSRSQNNNISTDKQSNHFYSSKTGQDKASFRAQLESTPESLC